MSTPTLRDEELEQLFLPKIFYIGEQLPQTSDDKCKFVMLGTPKEFMDDIRALIATNYKSNSEILVAIGEDEPRDLNCCDNEGGLICIDDSKRRARNTEKQRIRKALGLDKDVIEGSD